jgi:hypothetical protein
MGQRWRCGVRGLRALATAVVISATPALSATTVHSRVRRFSHQRHPVVGLSAERFSWGCISTVVTALTAIAALAFRPLTPTFAAALFAAAALAFHPLAPTFVATLFAVAGLTLNAFAASFATRRPVAVATITFVAPVAPAFAVASAASTAITPIFLRAVVAF